MPGKKDVNEENTGHFKQPSIFKFLFLFSGSFTLQSNRIFHFFKLNYAFDAFVKISAFRQRTPECFVDSGRNFFVNIFCTR